MTDLLVVVSGLNNLGVVRLNQGDLRGALDLFRESLSYTAGNLRPSSTPTTAPGPSKNASPTAAADASRSTPIVPHLTPNASIPATPPTPAESTQPDSAADVMKMSTTTSPFMHSKGINVLPMANAYSPDMLINTVIVSSIVVFNLAIVCHLKGLEGGHASSSRLFRAKSLYERSQCLLADANVPCHYSHGNPVTDMIYMASYNNLAQLHYETAQYAESKHCFDRLIHFAETMSPAKYGDAYVGSLMDLTKSNFLLNAIILQKQPGLAPAA